MQSNYMETTREISHIIIYDKSRNFVIETFKKKNNEFYIDKFNETVISKKNKLYFINN